MLGKCHHLVDTEGVNISCQDCKQWLFSHMHFIFYLMNDLVNIRDGQLTTQCDIHDYCA